MPTPDFLDFRLPPTHVALVTNEGTALTEELCKALQTAGNQVVVLNLNPSVKNQLSFPSLSLNITPADDGATIDESIKTAIQQIEQTHGKVGSFIHLHPHLEFVRPRFTQHFQTERDLIKKVFLLAKHLKAPLTELGETNRANFLTISRLDGQLGMGKKGNVSVLGGGLTGLMKSINMEWSNVFCRAVDIQPELFTGKIVEQIMAELHDANTTITEVAYNEEGRSTIRARESENPPSDQFQTKVNAESVFLVSGGARGVTATCVIEMAKTFGCKFILLGRSNLDFDLPAFAKSEDDENVLKRLIMEDLKARGEKPSLPVVKKTFKNIIAKKEITQTLNQIEAAGGKVVYVQGDVTNLASIRQGIDDAKALLGNITGIIHGAGRLADKYIQDKTATDFENVVSVKLDGFVNLLQCIQWKDLEHLILFSSVAGFYGNIGQSDYAIANEILSKAAHLVKTNHPEIHVSAINWGAWDAGMVSPELKKMFAEAGVSLVDSEGGAAMLVNELSTEFETQPQCIIGGTLPTPAGKVTQDIREYRISRKLKLENNEFLNHHVIQGKAVLPVVNAVGWMAQTCERLYPGFHIFEVADTKLFKGLVFDESIKEEYIIVVEEQVKSQDEIQFVCTVLSEGAKLPTFHYKANVTLKRIGSIEMPALFQPAINGTYEKKNGSYLYEDGSLFHGHYFQGIEEILDWDEHQVILSCRAPEVPIKDQGQFAISSVNTFFCDIQYQAMVIWVQRYNNGAKSLPLATKSATIYKPIPFGKQLNVHVDVIENSEFKMVANCTVYDEQGVVYMVTNGAAVTVSRDLTW